MISLIVSFLQLNNSQPSDTLRTVTTGLAKWTMCESVLRGSVASVARSVAASLAHAKLVVDVAELVAVGDGHVAEDAAAADARREGMRHQNPSQLLGATH